MHLVREGQGRVPDPVEVRHRVLQRREGPDERGRDGRLDSLVLEEPRYVVRQEQGDLERDVRVHRGPRWGFRDMSLVSASDEAAGCGCGCCRKPWLGQYRPLGAPGVETAHDQDGLGWVRSRLERVVSTQAISDGP